MSHHHRHNHAPHPQDPTAPQHSHRPVHNNPVGDSHSFPRANRAGQGVNYNVLKCRPVINQDSPRIQHDHLQVLLETDNGTNYWMTINIRSGQDQVYYFISENYQHPILGRIIAAQLPDGFTKLDGQPNGLSLDYIRDNLVDLSTMDKLKTVAELQGTDEQDSEGIADMLTTQLVNASRMPDAKLFIFGSRFDDGAKYSIFDLATGIHDIHMNQGSVGGHAGSNGIYQDGALLIHYPSENRWSAVFLKFASQGGKTDDSGNAA